MAALSVIDRNLRCPKYNKAISKNLAIGLLIIVCLVIAVGSYYALFALPKETPNGPKVTPTPTVASLPDLEISAIILHPFEPKAGVPFTAQVWVANIGEVKSGSFDIVIKIKDVSGGSTYPIGTFRKDPMNAGVDYIVWSDQVTVDFSGSHQLWAEIIPFLCEDNNDSNNVYGWQFTVTP